MGDGTDLRYLLNRCLTTRHSQTVETNNVGGMLPESVCSPPFENSRLSCFPAAPVGSLRIFFRTIIN